MITYNGFADNERRVLKHRPRKADAGHSVVETVIQRRGSAFSFRRTLTCQCGWTASTRSDPSSLHYRHEAHIKKETA